MKIDYTAEVWKEGEQYIAHASPLDLVSSGPTPEGAKSALKEAVPLFIETLQDMGTLSEVLSECGYREQGGAWVSPTWIGVERQSAAIGVS
jgi:predicted RNase H-like HicB family nuclease